MKKVLLVATVQSHICQFHKPLVEVLREQEDVEIHVAARDNLAEKNGLKLDFADKIYNISFSRSPLKMKNIVAYKELKNIIQSEKYDIIQCNTPVGGILTRLAARKVRKNGAKVIYTAHGFHFYKGAPLKNWIMYFPIEYIFSKWTDVLITINEEDYFRARKWFSCKVERIHGVGVNSNLYKKDEESARKLRKEHGFTGPVILCVGELLPNKNQKMLIEAMKEVIQKIPTAVLLIAGNGPEKENLEEYIEQLNLQQQVKLIGYRIDLNVYQKISNLGVSCSIREGLGLNLIEAMLSSNPIIGTKNRGHNELIENGINGYLVEQNDVHDLAKKIIEILSNDVLYENMAKSGREYGLKYSQDSVKEELKNILGGLENGI